MSCISTRAQWDFHFYDDDGHGVVVVVIVRAMHSEYLKVDEKLHNKSSFVLQLKIKQANIMRSGAMGL